MPSAQAFEVSESKIEDLFSAGSVAFEVPLFQRQYAWGREKVTQLLNDLYAEDSEWLRDGDSPSYFLGAIVVQRAASQSEPEQLLDGQQRLATLSLLLAVLRDRLREVQSADADELERYLRAGRIGEEKRPKLRMQEADRPVFEALLNAPLTALADRANKRHLLTQARDGIVKGLQVIIEKHQSQTLSQATILKRMASRLVYGVELVRIKAATDSSAFRLFETLNDRGLELNAADLVKNKLFSRSTAANLADVRSYWELAIDALGENDSVQFLRHYWTAVFKSVSKSRLYDVVRDHLQGLGQDKIPQFTRELAHAAEQYSSLISPRNLDAAGSTTLARLTAFGARSCRPALLLTALKHPDELPFVAKVIEIATVRQTIIGQGNPNALEAAYARFCETVRAGANCRSAISTCLRDIIPKDSDFRSKFAAADVENVTTTWRGILEALNETLSTGEMRLRSGKEVHVEHVLPRTPSAEALAEANLSSAEAEDLSGRLGNLTLLSGRRNQSASNKQFSAKRPVFEESEVALNQHFRQLQRWGRVEIETRSATLAELALRTWPLTALAAES